MEKYESPLLKNNDYYLGFETEGEWYWITYNKKGPFNPSGFTLCNARSQRVDHMDYSTELEIGKKLLREKFNIKEA